MNYIKLFEDFNDQDLPWVEVETSQIPNAGMGLFALQDIPEGEQIVQFTGKVIGTKAANKLKGHRSHYLIDRSDGKTLDVFDSDSPAIRANDAHGTKFINNSEIVEYDDYQMWLVATRDIHAGEEIFCDYGGDYWDNWSE